MEDEVRRMQESLVHHTTSASTNPTDPIMAPYSGNPLTIATTTAPMRDITNTPLHHLKQANARLSYQLEQSRCAHAEAVEGAEARKKEAMKWENEYGLLLQQNAQLLEELETSKGEYDRLRRSLSKAEALVKEKEDEVGSMAKALEMSELWESECHVLRRRVEAHSRKEEEMKLHIAKLDRYLLNMASELDESRGETQMKEKEKEMVVGERDGLKRKLCQVRKGMTGVIELLHHGHKARQSFDHVMDSLQSVLETFKASIRDSNKSLELCRSLAQSQYLIGYQSPRRKEIS